MGILKKKKRGVRYPAKHDAGHAARAKVHAARVAEMADK